MQNENVETVYNGAVNPDNLVEAKGTAPEYVQMVNPAATEAETHQKDIDDAVETYKAMLRESGMTEEQIAEAMNQVKAWAVASGDEQAQAMANVTL